MTFHESFTGFEDAEALVLVNLAGRDDRLLANHTFAFHLAVLTDGIVDPPSSAEQLGWKLPDVLDPDVVRQDVVPRVWARVFGQIRRSHGHANAVRLSIEEGAP